MASAPKLDKNHGFHKFIVQNQIDRDTYEEEQKTLMSLKSKGLLKQRQCPSERPTYIPPCKRSQNNNGSQSANKGILSLSNRNDACIKKIISC